MASLPMPPSSGLDSPPPSPANPSPPGGAPPPGGFGGTGVPGSPPPGPTDALKQITVMATEIDRALLALAEMAPGEIPEFGQSRKLLQAGLAKLLAGGVGEAGGGGTGSQFPGGGMVSGMPL